jgi:hypothetical protein
LSIKRFLSNFVLISIPTLIALILMLEFVFTVIIPASETPDRQFDNTRLAVKFDPSKPGAIHPLSDTGWGCSFLAG